MCAHRPSDWDTRSPSVMQQSELALQRLAGGLRELSTMKTDLAQYVAAGDWALLERQLGQLHGQWEELCTKVSAPWVGGGWEGESVGDRKSVV